MTPFASTLAGVCRTMKERMSDGVTLTWREVVDRNHSVMLDELSSSLDSLFEAEKTRSAAESIAAMERVRIATAESLNQILRRVRQADSEQAVFQLLIEATSFSAESAVVLAIERHQSIEDGLARNSTARIVASRGIHFENEAVFEISGAAAIVTALETKDLVSAIASPQEISDMLSSALDARESKVYLFPLTARQQVIAMLLAAGSVVPTTVELICGAASLKLEAIAAESVAKQMPVLQPLAASEALHSTPFRVLAPSLPGGTSPEPHSLPERRTWRDLSAEEQKLHLQAQRVARVKVAEMRIFHPGELRTGVSSGSIYAALQEQIDRARTDYRTAFVSKSSTMVDYLHLEMLRSLANDDDRLLGEHYPGPMV